MSATGTPDPTDEALLAALAALAGTEALPLLRRFGVQRARALAPALMAGTDEPSLGPLRDAREAQLGPNPGRVHWTWFVRAIREESPSVVRTVAAGVDEPLRSILCRELRLDPSDLRPDFPAEEEAHRFALGLWTERLVGDGAAREDDPLVIATLTALGPFATYRVARACGLAKLSTIPAAGRDPEGALKASRLESLGRLLDGPADARLVQIAAGDWASAKPLGRHRLAGLGLVTLGRLLATADPHRVRWALQHVPYPVAKRLRAASSQPHAAVRAVRAWEARLLDAAVALLRGEGRHPAPTCPEGSRPE